MATPEGWVTTTLDALAEIKRGASPRPINDHKWFAEIGRGWVRISDVTRSGRHLLATTQYLSPEGEARSVPVDPGDVIMSIAGSIGKPIHVGIPACIHDGFIAFKNLRREISPDWLIYFLLSQAATFAAAGQQGTQTNLNSRLVGRTTVTLPPLPEQRKIAAILSAVDEVIEKTEAVIESLQALKKAMMQELLTRGLPGRHTRFKQTEIGEVPEEWEVVPFGAILKRGPDNGLYRPKEDYGTGTPIVRIDSFASGDTLPSGGYQRVRLCADDVLRFRLSESEIVINRVNSLSHLAKAAYVGLLDEPTVFESNMMRVGVDGERVLPRFAFLWIASEMARTFFLARAKQAVAQASVNQQDVKTMPLPLPPFSEQETIVSTLDSLLKRIETESVVLNSAQSTKQALMSVLLTGELRVTPDKDVA